MVCMQLSPAYGAFPSHGVSPGHSVSPGHGVLLAMVCLLATTCWQATARAKCWLCWDGILHGMLLGALYLCQEPACPVRTLVTLSLS